MGNQFSIQDKYWDFRKLGTEAPNPNELPILDAYDINGLNHKSPSLLKVFSYIKECHTLLDIGAGDRHLKKNLEEVGWKGAYFSLDIEKKFSHDYYEIDKVNREFDCIIMFELIEHIAIEKSIEYITKAYALLKPGGILIISTPDTANINVFWQRDVTHIHPWPYRDVYAILKLTGFHDIKIFRLRLLNRIPNIKDNLKFILRKYICKIIGIGFTDSILAIAYK